jgi:hypothetical protein
VPDDSSLAEDLHLILGLLAQLYGSNQFAEAVPADAQGTFTTVRPSLSDSRAFVAWMRTQYGPSLVETRRRAEDEARVLLDEHAGRMTREHAARLGELLNQGTWAEVPHQNRFSPAFMGRTLDVLVEPIETFNEWTSRLWNARDDLAAEQAVDAILKEVR